MTAKHGLNQHQNQPAPCDSCAQAPRCMLSEISCHDFSVYVRENRTIEDFRSPNRRRYRKLMRSDT